MEQYLLARSKSIFEKDFFLYKQNIIKKVKKSTIMVVGGAGSIGSAVVKLLVKLQTKKILIVDISENNLVEIIRDIRSSNMKIISELQTFSLDCGSTEFEKMFINQKNIDYLFNFSALKHVRSERDIYTLKRLVDSNIINSVKLFNLAEKKKCKKYFCVSTDKATNPINMMGASKLLMEKALFSRKMKVKVSTARFANVLFSDGSLLYGFEKRLLKKQPLAVPTDIRRFFVTPIEAAQLCIISCFIGRNKEIFFPKTSKRFADVSLLEISKSYLKLKGFRPAVFKNEEAARRSIIKLIKNRQWPCFYFETDTSGEKKSEEFYTEDENVKLNVFQSIGVVKIGKGYEEFDWNEFISIYEKFKNSSKWEKAGLISIFKKYLKNFNHKETNKNLDQKM